jgi:MFS family permease
MIVMLGMVAGPLVAGILADRTGAYETGFRILATLAAMGSVFFVLARRASPPHHRRARLPAAAAPTPGTSPARPSAWTAAKGYSLPSSGRYLLWSWPIRHLPSLDPASTTPAPS